MGSITLVPTYLAKENREFRYIGEAPECAECPVGSVCHGLVKGRMYVVTNTRKKEHNCAVHNDGKVVAVEFAEVPMNIAVPKKMAVEGAIITLDKDSCDARWCENANLCSREYIPLGQKVKILSVNDRVTCLKGEEIISVSVEFEE